MQAIREIIHPNRKKITFSIPEEYVGHDLELVILPLAFPRDKKRSSVPGNYASLRKSTPSCPSW